MAPNLVIMVGHKAFSSSAASCMTQFSSSWTVYNNVKRTSTVINLYKCLRYILLLVRVGAHSLATLAVE